MKSCLLRLVTSRSKMTQLKQMLKPDHRLYCREDDLRTYLNQQLTADNLVALNSNCLYDLADTLVLISEQTPTKRLNFMIDLAHQLRQLIDCYYHRCYLSRLDFNSIYPHRIYKLQMRTEEIKAIELKAILRELDIYAIYQSYAEGSHYNRYLEWTQLLVWLKDGIDELKEQTAPKLTTAEKVTFELAATTSTTGTVEPTTEKKSK